MINTKNIRFRILLWYSLTLFIATVFIFGSFYVVTRQILYQQVDKELATHAGQIVEIVTRQGIGMHEALLKQQLYTEFSDIPGMVVVLIDENGNIIKNSLSNNQNNSYQAIFERAKNNSNTTYINQSIGNTPMRFAAQPIKDGDELVGMILVAHPIDAIQKSLNSLLGTLGIVFVLLIFPSILGGRILSGKIMRPIADISHKIEKISSEHLDQRVDTPKTGDEIETLGVTFNQLLDHLQESFQRERQFIGDVAHELKTPVATLKSGVELVLSKTRTKEQYQQALQDTLIDINRLSATIKNILDLAWLGAENTSSKETHFNLSNSFHELKEVGAKLSAQKRVRFKSIIEPNIIVLGTEDKIVRAVLNVIDNAIKYTPQGGSVSVLLHQKSNQAIIEIKDTGIGISTAELPHIFTRFYRGSKTAKTLGSGLGLAITQGIIASHHGDIKISSTINKGTTVTIALPLMFS